ncbi:MAG: hypothetical protein WAM65_09670, partial [Candidatus Korobacteraceae bacterium]
ENQQLRPATSNGGLQKSLPGTTINLRAKRMNLDGIGYLSRVEYIHRIAPRCAATSSPIVKTS